jgi:hypothetical protein
MARIRSIIEIHHGRDDDMKDEKQPEEKSELQEYEEKSNGSLSPDSQKKNIYRSEAVSDRNRMFHSVRQRQGNVRQDVKVEVKIEQQSDQCLNGCFKAITSCFKR